MSTGRRRLAMAAGAAALLVLAILLARRHGDPAPAAAESAGPSSQPGLAPAQAGSSPLASSVTTALNVTVIDPQFEICQNPGLAMQSLSSLLGTGDRERSYLDRQVQDLRQGAVNALLQSTDDERRMAGHLLNGDTAAAAQLAQSTSQPQAYGMAWLACRNAARARESDIISSVPPLAPDALPMGLPEPSAVAGACAGLSLERWAQLAPDNAAPWLELAAVAQQRGDRAQAIDGMYHAGLARSVNTGWGWLPGIVAGVLPESAIEGGRMQLMLDVTGQQSSMMDLTGVSGIGSFCGAPALADANTHQQCERIAQLMMGRSPNVSERLVGVGLAERLGLPASQMPVSRKEVTAALQSISDDFQGAMAQPQGCDALGRINRWLADSSRQGEWQAAQQRLARP